jgi:hypothetical protein
MHQQSGFFWHFIANLLVTGHFDAVWAVVCRCTSTLCVLYHAYWRVRCCPWRCCPIRESVLLWVIEAWWVAPCQEHADGCVRHRIDFVAPQVEARCLQHLPRRVCCNMDIRCQQLVHSVFHLVEHCISCSPKYPCHHNLRTCRIRRIRNPLPPDNKPLPSNWKTATTVVLKDFKPPFSRTMYLAYHHYSW